MMESGEQRERRSFFIFKIRYWALTLVWLGALIGVFLSWRTLPWPWRIAAAVVLAIASPSINELFETYPQYLRRSRAGRQSPGQQKDKAAP